MHKQVDARGKNNPLAVICTKKALESIEQGVITTIVDNEQTKERVRNLANSLTLKTEISESQGEYTIHIYKEPALTTRQGMDIECDDSPKRDLVIMITSDCLGEGTPQLGRTLMKGYLYTLTEVKPYPKALLFVNQGVMLTVEGSESLEHLRTLEANGVEILSSGTCLDYYKVKDKLVVGGVANLYTIVDKMNNARNTIKL